MGVILFALPYYLRKFSIMQIYASILLIINISSLVYFSQNEEFYIPIVSLIFGFFSIFFWVTGKWKQSYFLGK